MGPPKNRVRRRSLNWKTIRALAIIFWRQGVLRETRWKFWFYLYNIIKHNPKVWDHYISICAYFEHFYEYRQIVRHQIETQLAEFLATSAATENQQEKEAELPESAAA